MADESSKQALIAELSAARGQLVAHGIALRHNLSITEKARRHVFDHPLAWVGGAVATGLLLSQILAPRKRAVYQSLPMDRSQAKTAGKAALGVTILKLVVDLAKPALIRMLTTRLAERYASGQRHD